MSCCQAGVPSSREATSGSWDSRLAASPLWSGKHVLHIREVNRLVRHQADAHRHELLPGRRALKP